MPGVTVAVAVVVFGAVGVVAAEAVPTMAPRVASGGGGGGGGEGEGGDAVHGVLLEVPGRLCGHVLNLGRGGCSPIS